MAFSKINEHYEELKKDILAYIKYKLEYTQLLVLKKTTKALSKLIKIILGVFLLCFFLFFASLGVAFLIGDYLDNVGYGFLIVGGFYFFLFILIILFGGYFFRAHILSLKALKMTKIKI